MPATSSHHTFHRLNQLLTTFLAQMQDVPAPVEPPLPVSEKPSATKEQSIASTDSTSTRVASVLTIDQAAPPPQALELAHSSLPAEYDDGCSKDNGVRTEGSQKGFSSPSAATYPKRSLLRCRKACLIINPRAGHNFTRITDVLAVLSAAGWKTDIAVKQYAGHVVELAARAAEQGYDLVIAYGGDGTINHVVNGVMGAKGKGQRKAIGVIPGGTANQWAAETCVPVDPVKAALALIDSNVRKVDIGRVQVQAIKFPHGTQESQQQKEQKVRKRKARQVSENDNYFLLTAGLGIDAAVISRTSKELKQRVGILAFDLAAAESLQEQHSFPIEITIVEGGQDQLTSWSGEAYQVILGNTRRYANAVGLTPEAHLDDGKLDLCVITKGNTIATLQQISSLLFRHIPDEMTVRHFLAAHFLVTVPASIQMHHDGSAVQLEDYLSKSDREALLQERNKEHVMVTYRFDAVPNALRMAIPDTYDNTLFEHATQQEESSAGDRQRAEKDTAQQRANLQGESSDGINMLQEQGYKVKVNGTVQVPNKRQTSIIAGSIVKKSTGETKPVAVRIDNDTTIFLQTGEQAPLSDIHKLPDDAVIIVTGKKSKRGVIKAKQVVLEVTQLTSSINQEKNYEVQKSLPGD